MIFDFVNHQYLLFQRHFSTNTMLLNLILIIFVLQIVPLKSFGATELDLTFNPVIGGTFADVFTPLVQPDGKIIVRGNFQSIGGKIHPKIARLNSDGTLDETFNPDIASNEFFNLLAVQPDGKILVSSSFNAKIFRLNSDGSIDHNFNSGVGANGGIMSVALLPDGRLLAAGNFTIFNGVPRNQLVRLDANGSLDNDFNPLINSIGVFTLAIQSDEKILIGGDIFSVGNTRRDAIARLNPDGTLDSSFNPAGTGFNGTINKIVIQNDGKILAGGAFSNYNGVGRLGMARLNSNGTLDESFSANINVGSFFGRTFSITLLPDGKIFITGHFDNVNGVRRVRIARINSNGSVDETFNPGTGVKQNSSSTVYATSSLYLPDGKIFITSNFFSINGVERYGIAALNPDATVAETFSKGAHYAAGINKIISLPNGKMIIGGHFYSVNGINRKAVARLNADGPLDSSFNINLATVDNFSGVIYSGALQPDGKVLIGGEFSRVNGTVKSGIVRLNTDDTVDTTFNIFEGANQIFRDIKTLPSGKIIAVGNFGVTRYNPDGSVDSTFAVSPNDDVRAVTIQSDGKIVIAGDFTAISGISRNRIARLNADGSLDTTFTSSANQTINSVVLSPDEKIIIGGNFTTVNNNNLNRLARLNQDGSLDLSFNISSGANLRINTVIVLPGGKIIVGGIFTTFAGTPRAKVVRLETNGAIDLGFATNLNLFAPEGEGASVSALAVQLNENLLIGGFFTKVNNSNSNSLVRLSALHRQTLFDFDGDGKADNSVFRQTEGIWYLQRSQSGFAAIRFGLSADTIAPADFDGDGKTDVAVFRNGNWFTINSSTNQLTAIQFGQPGDLPRPADFDGDGRADIAVFRPSNGTWYRLNSSNNQFVAVNFGLSGDVPLVADFDGDGKSDVAVYRPNGNFWYRLNSSNNQFVGQQFGAGGDVPVPADFDGDGKTDVSVYRPSEGIWYRINSFSNQLAAVRFGAAGDVPVPADYDGDARADVAVFRPASGTWYRLNSANNSVSAEQFGANGDLALPSVFNR